MTSELNAPPEYVWPSSAQEHLAYLQGISLRTMVKSRGARAFLEPGYLLYYSGGTEEFMTYFAYPSPLRKLW